MLTVEQLLDFEANSGTSWFVTESRQTSCTCLANKCAAKCHLLLLLTFSRLDLNYACASSLQNVLLRSSEMLVNSVSVFICCELPEEFYCYIAEPSMIYSIALATQETKTSCLVVVILL